LERSADLPSAKFVGQDGCRRSLHGCRRVRGEGRRCKQQECKKSRKRGGNRAASQGHLYDLLDYKGGRKVSREWDGLEGLNRNPYSGKVGLGTSSSLPFVLRYPARHLHSAQPARVLGDASIERLSDALPVLRGLQLVFVGGVADKRNLGENRRHIRADQYDKRCLLHAAVTDPRSLHRQP